MIFLHPLPNLLEIKTSYFELYLQSERASLQVFRIISLNGLVKVCLKIKSLHFVLEIY